MKLKLLACCLLLAGSASAVETEVYVGGKFGVQSLTSEINSSETNVELPSVGAEGSQFGLFGGYISEAFTRYYWGVEAEYVGHSVKELKTDALEFNLEKEYGLGFLFGKRYTNNVNLYGRVGAAQAYFDGKDLGGDSGSDDVLALHAGFGFELKGKFPSMIDFRAEYRYTKYSEINFSENPTTVKNSPRSHSFSMGLIYRY